MNALTRDWNRWDQIYLFPPINLLREIIPRLENYSGHDLLIVPNAKRRVVSLRKRFRAITSRIRGLLPNHSRKSVPNILDILRRMDRVQFL